MRKFRQLLLLVVTFFFLLQAGFAQISWYKNLNGSIDKYPITMHLHKMDHSFSGYYYYHSKQEPVYFTGEDTTIAGKIKLLVFTRNKEQEFEIFTFSIAENAAKGEWKKNETSKSLSFSASEAKISGLPVFEFVFAEGSYKLKPNLAESPEATYEAASVWPKNTANSTNFIKKIIREDFGEKQTQENIANIFLRQKKQLIAEYLEEHKDITEEEMKDSYSLNMSQTAQMMIAYSSSKIITLAHHSYSYTGGAHGNYGTDFTSIDLIANKKLKLPDILNTVGLKQLPKLLEKNFRSRYGLSDKEELTAGGLFENKIEPNDNFYVTGKGIGFNYVPYEIGPYAMGEVNLFIHFTELNVYLQPGFKKLIQ